MSHEYLAHHGIKGQKWGVRRFQNRNGVLTTKGKKRYNETESEEKLHLGLDKNGNINLIRGKTTKEAKIKFAVKSSIFIAGMTVSLYVANHPDIVNKGKIAAEKILKKKGSLNVEKTVVDSGIYSKSLGRMLTIAEAMDAGLI